MPMCIYNSDSVMQKSEIPVLTCILADCSLVEVVVWKEVTRRKIEIGHKTESKCKKGKRRKQQREEDKEKEQRVGDKDCDIGSILSMSSSLLSSSAV